MKIHNFRCENEKCKKQWWDLFDVDEEVPDSIVCAECGEKMLPFNFKNNPHCVHIMDQLK